METTSVQDRFLAILRQKHNEGRTREQFYSRRILQHHRRHEVHKKEDTKRFLPPQEVSSFHVTSETASIVSFVSKKNPLQI